MPLFLYLFLAVLMTPQLALTQQTAAYDAIVKRYQTVAGPGMAILVAKGDQVVYRSAFGKASIELDVPLQPEHVFRIGSITKQFTAAAILRLAEQGKLSVQDPITRFLPDYPTHGRTITIEHLLTHTSGIRSYTSIDGWRKLLREDQGPEAMMARFKDEPLDFEPGTEWRYNNSGYLLLGYIIEKITGQSYADHIEQEFLKPLGLHGSFYGEAQPIIPNRVAGYDQKQGRLVNGEYLSPTQTAAAGALLMTVDDLFTWYRAVMEGQVISSASLQQATTPYRLASGKETNYGYGWEMNAIRDRPTIEHNGSINGFRAASFYLPEEKIFVAVFANCPCLEPDNLAYELIAQALGQPIAAGPAITAAAAALAPLTGVYQTEKGEQRLLVFEEGKLYTQRGEGARLEVRPFANDRFFAVDYALELAVERDAAGKVAAIVTSGRGKTTRWARTDQPLPSGAVAMEVPEAILQAYTGTYSLGPNFDIVVRLDGGKLWAKPTGQQEVELHAETDNLFVIREVKAKMEFVEEEGRVKRLVLHQGGREMPAERK